MAAALPTCFAAKPNKGAWLISSPAASRESAYLFVSESCRAACFALFDLVFGSKEGDPLHGGYESWEIDDGRTIADFGSLFRVPKANKINL